MNVDDQTSAEESTSRAMMYLFDLEPTCLMEKTIPFSRGLSPACLGYLLPGLEFCVVLV